MMEFTRFIIMLISSSIFVCADNFPVMKFYQFQNFLSPNLYFNVSDTQLCKGKQMNKNSCCSCQQPCMTYKTCCIDYLWYKRPAWSSLDEYLDYFVEQTDKQKEFTCLPVIQNIKSNDLVERILIVSVHPNSTEKDFLPVVSDDNLVYFNPTSAAQHGVLKTRLLNLTITCQYVNVTDGLFSFSKCHYMVKVEDDVKQHLQFCHLKPVQNVCHKPDGRDTVLCGSYKGTISQSNTSFRNIHCLKCGGYTTKEITVQSCRKPPKETFVMRYSIVISYSENLMYAIDKNGDRQKIGLHCGPNELYDFNTKSCKQFQCGFGYVRQGYTCIKTYKNSNSTSGINELDSLDTRLRKCMLTKSFAGANVILRYFGRCKICESLKDKFPSYHIIEETDNNRIILYTINKLDDLQTLDNILTSLSTLSGMSVLNVSSANNIQTSSLHGFDLSRMFPRSRQCFEPQLQNSSSIWLNEVCDLIVGDSTFNKDDFNIWLHYSFINPSSIQKNFHVATCKQYYLSSNCLLQNIIPQDYILHNDSTITVLTNDQQLYNVSSYVPLHDGIGICLDNYGTAHSFKPEWLQTTHRVEEYITMLGVIVSAFCYLMIIFTYLYFKELRTIPGLNIVALCIVLLLSDVLVLSTIFIKPETATCKVTAVFLHWSLLTVQTWTAIISYEVWFTLRKVTSSRFGRSFKRFYLYCFLALFLPTVFIAITSTLDFQNVQFIGYGLSSSGCWIHSYHARIIVYITPVALVACFDLSILIWVISKIYKQQSISKQLLNKPGANDNKLAKTALKLVVLLGCIEIIGFVQIPKPNSTTSLAFNASVSTLFTFLRSFRGLFVWLLYICFNRRVWSHYPCFTDSSMDSPVLLTKSSRVASLKHAVSVKESKL